MSEVSEFSSGDVFTEKADLFGSTSFADQHGLVAICPFLAVDHFTDQLLILKAVGLGTFTWCVSEMIDGEWRAVGCQQIAVVVGTTYRLTCYAHQRLSYGC